jgi:hypothetical protein
VHSLEQDYLNKEPRLHQGTSACDMSAYTDQVKLQNQNLEWIYI